MEPMTSDDEPAKRLARTVARAQRVALGAVVIALVAIALALVAFARAVHVEVPTGPPTLDAAEVTLHDGDGNLRGRWSAQGLSLADRTGRMRAGLTLGNDGAPNLTLFSATGRVRAVVGLGADDTPAITLHDGASRVRTRIVVDGDLPSVTVTDAQGSVVGRLPAPSPTQATPAPGRGRAPAALRERRGR